MKVVNRLAQLLNFGEDERGAIKHIVENTNLGRTTVAELLQNKAASIRYETIAEICRYLIRFKGVDPAILPGALFEFAADEFWLLLSEQERIEFCMGNRRDANWTDKLVMAADAELQSVLIQRTTEYGSPPKVPDKKNKVSHSRQVIVQQLITAPSRNGDNEEETRLRESERIWKRFESRKKDKAIVCLGSVKSNSVIERFIASCFPCAVAFKSEDGVKLARNRSCPFTMVLRPTDPHIKSCCCGKCLSQSDSVSDPGIYYEQADKTWAHVQSSSHCDGAIVLYRYNKSLRTLCMCLGGYSSRATRFLTDFLSSGEADSQLWPPSYEQGAIQIGLFIVRFTLDKNAGKHQKPVSTEVLSVAEEVIRTRWHSSRTDESE